MATRTSRPVAVTFMRRTPRRFSSSAAVNAMGSAPVPGAPAGSAVPFLMMNAHIRTNTGTSLSG